MGSENRGWVPGGEPQVAYFPDTRFYRVEEVLRSESDCKCPNCVQWTVVYDDPDPTEIGTSWEGDDGRDAAEDICDLMNMAYERGRERSPETVSGNPTHE